MKWAGAILFLTAAALAQELPCDIAPKVVRGYSTATNTSICLVWPTNSLRTEILISKRIYTNKPSAWQAWTPLYTNSNPATVTLASSYCDTVTNAIPYEYCLATLTTNWTCPSSSTNNPTWSYDYIGVGHEVPLVDSRGRLILLVESGIAGSIAIELTTLTNDLICEGYQVYLHNVAAAEVTDAGWVAAVAATKALIAADYATDTNADWTLFIVGHVPIPYAGLSSPGSHTDNYGAHVADWYYADMGSAWTDSTVNDTSATETNCWNIPGDGKFDPSYLPAMPAMRLGRVDLRNLPVFGKTEVQLLQQYLNRNHAWRAKQFTARDRGLVITNGLPFEIHSLFSSFFGNVTNCDLGDWLSTATNSASSYIFAASEGSASYTNDHQVGTSAAFAATNLYAVFTTMYGSYYGDWNSALHTNDVAVAALCNAGYPLTVTYRENTINMDSTSLGEPIGQETYAMSANFFPDFSKRYIQYGYIFGGSTYQVTEQVHAYVSLMGDPTLRARIVAPPTNVFILVNSPNNSISWGNASDSNVVGYHVYRAPSTNLNSFTRLTTSPVASPYLDSGASPTSYRYMVRTVKLEQSSARSFYNASLGVLDSGTHTNYHVSTTGSDSNPGTSASPFLTVQKGINTAQAGDTVTVDSGAYTNYLTSARSGTSAAHITLDGQSLATIPSLLLSHQYIDVFNFTIAGKPNAWWVFMEHGGHHCVLSNNVFDGAYNTNADRILRWNTPESTELPWGTNCASDCLVISNLFKQIVGTTCIEVFGDRNVIQGNRLIDGDSVDWFHAWGRTNRIVGNLCSNEFTSGLKDNHPDCFQSYGLNGAGAKAIVIESNVFLHSEGDAQICMFEGQDCADLRDYTFRNNLFYGISSKGTIACPEVSFYNNVFVNCSTNPTTAGAVLIYTTATNLTYTNFAYSTGHSGRVFNNVFLNCGGTNTDRGWYYFYTYLTNAQADFNFVSKNNHHAVDTNLLHQAVGDPGGWDVRKWWEPHGLNGGDPKFASESGDFRLLAGSPLINAGTNLYSIFTEDIVGTQRASTGPWDIGAYAYNEIIQAVTHGRVKNAKVGGIKGK